MGHSIKDVNTTEVYFSPFFKKWETLEHISVEVRKTPFYTAPERSPPSHSYATHTVKPVPAADPPTPH